MNTKDSSIIDEEETPTEAVPHLNPSILLILSIISVITLILGFFAIFSVIIDTIQHSQINYPDTILISLLLIFGGLILLSGTIIMKNWAPLPQKEATEESSEIRE